MASVAFNSFPIRQSDALPAVYFDPDNYDPAADPGPTVINRDPALPEEESAFICVNTRPNGNIVQDIWGIPDPTTPKTCIHKRTGVLRTSVPFAPKKAAVLGYNASGGPLGEPDGALVQLWSDDVQTNPELGATETWELRNWSADAHPPRQPQGPDQRRAARGSA